MDTVQDKSEAFIEKVQDINGDTKSTPENQTKSKRNLGSKCISRSAARGCAMPVPSRTINLLEHDDLVASAGELAELQAQIHRARKKNYDLQTLTQLETHYTTMKQKFDSALKKASEEQHYGLKTDVTA